MNRKIIVRVSVALLTLIIGITGAYLWSKSHPRLESFEEVDMAAIPRAGYCEMRNNPDNYSGKVLRIDADMYWFTHGYFLYDEKYAENSDDRHLIDSGRTAILFNARQADTIIETFEPFFGIEASDRFLRIRAVGRFTHERPEGYSDAIKDRTAFHFEIYSVDSVELKTYDN